MKTIPLSAVADWSNDDCIWGIRKWYPRSIDLLCPHCKRMVNLTLGNLNYDQRRDTISATCRCPACSNKTSVWVIEPGNGGDTSQRTCFELCVHPNPPMPREPVLPEGHLAERALERTYYAAIQAYNAGLWDACATSCRKTLEGIVRSLNPESKGSLFQQLKDVFESENLTEPLVHVAESLRKGGNIAAHFDLERETDHEVAAIMVDLLDYFLEYAFLLKDKAKELEKRLDLLVEEEA